MTLLIVLGTLAFVGVLVTAGVEALDRRLNEPARYEDRSRGYLP